MKPLLSTLEDPSPGKVTGLTFNGKICQYLVIPYAGTLGPFQRYIPTRPWKDGTWGGKKLEDGLLHSKVRSLRI